MADFDNTTWDVAKEADKLHQSLFGNYRKTKVLMKRKEREDSLDVSQHRAYKKQKKELYDLHATSNVKVEKEIRNTKLVEQKSSIKSNDVSENTLNRKIKKTTVTAVNDSLHKSAIHENNSMEDFSQDMKKKVRKKKKRKRKCKKNKFKDYSKPDSVPADESIGHSTTQVLPISSSHQDKHEKNKSNEVTSGNENTKSERQKKTKKHRLKRDKQNSFDSNLMTDIRKEPMNLEQSHKQIKPFEKSSSKHHRNKFDPQKLQAILQADDVLKAQATTCDKVGAIREQGQGMNEKIKRPGEDFHEAPGSLIEKSRKRLNAARFRYLNEQLYTRTGSEAFQMFSEDKVAFRVYHEGFQGQVDKWPVNPVDLMIDFIKSKPKHLVVADFGCGDAKLAQNVPNKVHSFDLVALNNHVTVCDMAQVPLKDTSVDIAVFCLSLMGTNLSSYLTEANRVLRKGGILKIAEVTSRFHSIGQFILKVEKMGFKVTNQDNTNKMFVMIDFRKTGSPNPSAAQIKLDACVYKKR